MVVTVFLSILNQMGLHLVQNRKENCHHDHIPFNLKGFGYIVFSVYLTGMGLTQKNLFGIRFHRIEFFYYKSNLDCNYTSAIDLLPNGIPFGVKSSCGWLWFASANTNRIQTYNINNARGIGRLSFIRWSHFTFNQTANYATIGHTADRIMIDLIFPFDLLPDKIRFGVKSIG